jgi:hypothetical protein
MAQNAVYDNPMQRVKKYQPAMFDNPTATMVANFDSDTHANGMLLDVAQTAQWYATLLNASPLAQDDIVALAHAALNSQVTKSAAQMFSELHKQLNPSLQTALAKARQQMYRETCLRGAPVAPVQMVTGASLDSKRKQSEPGNGALPAANPPKKAKTGDNNLSGREMLASIDTLREKIEKIVSLSEDCPPTRDLTASAKTFAMRTMRPVVNCLNSHHCGSIDAFCNHWGDRFRMKFSDFCCKGVGPSCVN